MAKQRNDFGRAWRDKNKCEKSCGHVLLTKRTCKNIQEPIVCRIVLGRLNLKLCPETKKNTQEYSSWKIIRIMVISWWTSHDLVRKKTFVRKCYAYQSRLMLPFSSCSGQSTCGKSQEQNWLASYSFKLTSPNKLVKKRKKNWTGWMRKKVIFIMAWTWKKIWVLESVCRMTQKFVRRRSCIATAYKFI